MGPRPPPLLLTSGGQHWRHVQTCSLEDLPHQYWHLVVATETRTVGWLTSGWYASYWNAVLSNLHVSLKYHVSKQKKTNRHQQHRPELIQRQLREDLHYPLRNKHISPQRLKKSFLKSSWLLGGHKQYLNRRCPIDFSKTAWVLTLPKGFDFLPVSFGFSHSNYFGHFP